MFRHLAASRWAKAALLAVTLGFCGYGLFVERDKVIQALSHLSWFAVAGALVAAVAGLGCMMLSWRALLADLGSPLTLRAATRVLFVAQLAKYVPGSVWAAGAQVEIGRRYQVPRQRSATAAVMGLMVSLAVALLTATVALPLSSAGAARHYWWALMLAPFALATLYPPLASFLLNQALRLLRRPPLERRISMGGMARSVGWAALGWALFGAHAWLLVTDLTGAGVRVLPVAVGGYALAWSVGFLLIPFPGGAGPREVALIWALSPAMSSGQPLTVALVSRVVMTAADLLWAGTAFWLGRADQREAAGTAAPPAAVPAQAADLRPPAPRPGALDEPLREKGSYT